MSRFGLLLLLIVFPLLAFAGPREVLLEWEPDPEAITYELQIGELGKPKIFKSATNLKSTEWTGALNAGKYWMRVRARDDRGVPGEWSEKIDFQVTLQPVNLVKPTPDEILKADDEKEDIELKWEAMPHAKSYVVAVTDESGKVVSTQETKETSVEVSLGSAMKYSWTVQAVDETGTPGAKPETAPSFVVLGEALDKPEIVKPPSTFVRKLDFEKPEKAEALKITINRFDKTKNEWVKVSEGEIKKANAVPFKQAWPGGEYKVSAVAEGKYRAPSSVSEVTFEVESGARTVEAEHRAVMRRVIERTNDWYFNASYIVSMINYQSSLRDFGAGFNSKFNTFTGTGLLGVGRFWKKSPWGFYASIDYGGMTVEPDGTSVQGEQSITNFLGVETSGLYRWAFGRSDVRVRAGAYRQEVPELVNPQTGEMSTFSVMGPTFGAEYVYSLSPKFVAQASFNARIPATGKTSGGFAVDQTINWQTGLTGGMRMTEAVTGLAGVSYKQQGYTYKNSQGTENSISMSGPFLQFILEYDF